MARLVYAPDRSLTLHGQAGVTEHLGQAQSHVKDSEVWAWMTTLVEPFDTITTPEGMFVVSRPAANASRGFFHQPEPKGFLS